MPTLFTLSASQGHDIVCGMIAMSIIASVAVVTLGFPPKARASFKYWSAGCVWRLEPLL